jgi:hypothetical protein
MPACACGNPVKSEGEACLRCGALRVLELGAAASDDEIKTAFHMLAKVWHPDRFQGDASLEIAAEQKLKDINAAYAFLTSPAGRAGALSSDSPVAAAARSRAAAPKTSGLGSIVAVLNLFFKCVLVLIALLLCRYLWIAFNVQNSTSEAAAKVYDFGKENVAPGLQGPKQRFLAAIDDDLERIGIHKTEPVPAAVPAATLETGEAASANQRSAQPAKTAGLHSSSSQPASGRPAPRKVYSYITVGSTRAEVLDQVGAPTGSTDAKLVYGQSELYFKNDAVTGWKIDAANPIRVKLWPESAVDPALTSFTVGSTRDVVLVVQGTPTAFSDDKFEYGTSEVYFQNHRVVRWKSDAASVQLRALLP